MARRVLLAAGGTGGHLFPALALYGEMERRGWEPHLATDARADRFAADIAPERLHILRAGTVSASPLSAAQGLAGLAAGILQARRLIRAVRPAAIVGFGGYPTVPPLLAARLAGLPIIVHDANAVVGRANRLLLRLGAHLATAFPEPQGAERARAATLVGNPVRPGVAAAAQIAYAPPEPGKVFRLLVFGGSQGARVFSEVVPAAVARLARPLRTRLRLVQQCRAEDLEAARAAYADLKVKAELAAFFDDLPQRIAAAHLVISRSGASTVAELAVIGRPAILVPYPHALDQDQAANARALADAGGAWTMPQSELTPERLAERLAGLMESPTDLALAAAAVRILGWPDAVRRLADLVKALAGPAGAKETT